MDYITWTRIYVINKEKESDNQTICLAAVQSRSIHLWHIPSTYGSAEDLPEVNSDLINKIECPSLTYQPFSDPNDSIQAIEWDPCSGKLASLQSSGMMISFRRLNPGRHPECESHTLDLGNSPKSHKNLATCIAFSQRSGRYLAVGQNDGCVRIFSCRKQVTFRSMVRCNQNLVNNLSSSNEITCITWTGDDQCIITGHCGGYLLLFRDVFHPDNNQTQCIPFPQKDISNDYFKPPACVCLRSSRVNCNLFCCGYSDGSIIVWTMKYSSPYQISNDNILVHWDPQIFCSSKNHLEYLKYDISISLSTINDQLLISAGAPDLNLRIWNIKSYLKEPIKTLKPLNEKYGYLNVALASDAFTLATGLLNGQIWIYDLRNLSHPITCLQSNSHSYPVKLIAFATKIHSNDEVKFENISKSDHNFLKSSGSYLKHSDTSNQNLNDSRSILGDLSNIKPCEQHQPQQEQQRSWASLFHEFSIPELSSQSDSSIFPSSLEPNSPHTDLIDSLIDLDQNKQTTSDQLISDRNADMKLITQSYNITNNSSNANSFAPNVSDINSDLLNRILRFHFSSLISELNWSHNQLLFQFSKLESKVDRLTNQFTHTIINLKHENQTLRKELDKRYSYF